MSRLHADCVDATTGCEARFWDPARVQITSDRAFALLVEALGVAALNETLLIFSRPGPGSINDLGRSVRLELLAAGHGVVVGGSRESSFDFTYTIRPARNFSVPTAWPGVSYQFIWLLVLGCSTSWQGRHGRFRSCLKDYLAAGWLALGWMR